MSLCSHGHSPRKAQTDPLIHGRHLQVKGLWEIVLFLLFYFPLFFFAWDIYCFFNVKNFKYREAWRKIKQTFMYILLL